MRETITCENRLVPIAADMPLCEASLLGCAIPTGSGVVRNTAKKTKREARSRCARRVSLSDSLRVTAGVDGLGTMSVIGDSQCA